MGVPLSVAPQLAEDLRLIANSQGMEGEVHQVCESLLLRPSNAIVEASDYLSPLHDWIQQTDEVTAEIARALFVPGR
eukprot:UN4219